ncbi:MAG: DUF6112 family protein [Propionibacteriaceae bacterium]|jgi:hypothetical protein|nr:DUF6112 family protein [Propionibacteriaceae bacterium]
MSPDFSATNGTVLASVVWALLTIVLIAAAAALIASVICWAYGGANGCPHDRPPV